MRLNEIGDVSVLGVYFELESGLGVFGDFGEMGGVGYIDLGGVEAFVLTDTSTVYSHFINYFYLSFSFLNIYRKLWIL